MHPALSFLLLVLGLTPVQERGNTGTDPGVMAPDFALDGATRDSILDRPVHLSDFTGKSTVVLAFYPADWSGGCTAEMCTFRDDFSELEGSGATILAVSGDYVYSHHEWARHHNLPFLLLSDHSHEVAKKYDSFNEKSGFNKRTVFVIDRTGKIVYRDLSFKAREPGSFEQLRKAIEDHR
jgi:peroxiredoxin Q/BCP